MNIIEILTPSYDAAWLPWAVQYFFLVAIACTTAITAAMVALRPVDAPERRLLPAAITVLAVTAISAPVALLADLHQPARFWHFYAHFTPWSWMSIGAVLLPIFVSLSLLFCALWWLGKNSLLRVCALALLVSALSILIYTGAEVMILRSRPLWHTYFLPINFALTGWLAALGAMLFVARWLPGGVGALPAAFMRKLGLSALVLLTLSAVAWLVTGWLGLDPSFAAALELFTTYPTWRTSLIASVVLALLLFLLLRVPASRLCTPVHSMLCALLMMAAAWVFRWIVLMSVQGVPKYGAGLYLHSMPLGSDGLLGMLGVFGLCTALLALVTWFIDRYPSWTALRPHNA
ncbi:NrfD/PsrC family molybdoenzyme membrane anchor subunit [Paenalcaligenes hominis]|uniref:NrfD/PsrC family molybdoenzyme membrane anchor subunit n=1 Tax=Paenalcaligenes hominis TaxID=643674 RepID=UPI003525FA12